MILTKTSPLLETNSLENTFHIEEEALDIRSDLKQILTEG